MQLGIFSRLFKICRCLIPLRMVKPIDFQLAGERIPSNILVLGPSNRQRHCLSHFRLNSTLHNIFWKSPVLIIGARLYDLDFPRDKWLNSLQTVGTLIKCHILGLQCLQCLPITLSGVSRLK